MRQNSRSCKTESANGRVHSKIIFLQGSLASIFWQALWLFGRTLLQTVGDEHIIRQKCRIMSGNWWQVYSNYFHTDLQHGTEWTCWHVHDVASCVSRTKPTAVRSSGLGYHKKQFAFCLRLGDFIHFFVLGIKGHWLIVVHLATGNWTREIKCRNIICLSNNKMGPIWVTGTYMNSNNKTPPAAFCLNLCTIWVCPILVYTLSHNK